TQGCPNPYGLWCFKSHFGATPLDCWWQDMAQRLTKQELIPPSFQVHLRRQSHGPFHKPMIEERVSSLNAERHRISVVPLEQTRQVNVTDFRQAVPCRLQVLRHNSPISCEVEPSGCPPWLQKRSIV